MEDVVTEESGEEPEEQEDAKPNLVDLMKELPNAPDQMLIDSWKAKYKEVFVSGFSEQEMYIWRGVTRSEYKKMQIEQQSIATLQQANQQTQPTTPEILKAQVADGINAQYSLEENLVATCVLWPKLSTEELSRKAGTVPALLEQIMSNSNFMSAQQASLLVMRL